MQDESFRLCVTCSLQVDSVRREMNELEDTQVVTGNQTAGQVGEETLPAPQREIQSKSKQVNPVPHLVQEQRISRAEAWLSRLSVCDQLFTVLLQKETAGPEWSH